MALAIASDELAAEPFVTWLNERYAALEAEYEHDGIAAGDAMRGPAEDLAGQLGWGSSASGSRRLRRYRNQLRSGSRDGKKGEYRTDTYPRAIIEDALDHVGMTIEDLYPELVAPAAPVRGLIVTAYCPQCEEDVVPNDDGTCVWCDAQTGGHDLADDPDPARIAERSRCACGATKTTFATMCRSCASSQRDENGRKLPIYSPLDYVCPSLGPNCSGRKPPKARSCWGCYSDAGGHTGRKHRKGQNLTHITEGQLLEAKSLYASGLSIRKVAAQIYPATTYASERSCVSALFDAFKTRGWPLRDKGAASRAGMRRRVAEMPQCAFIKHNGTRCARKTGRPNGYCWHHDPEVLETRLQELHRYNAERQAA